MGEWGPGAGEPGGPLSRAGGDSDRRSEFWARLSARSHSNLYFALIFLDRRRRDAFRDVYRFVRAAFLRRLTHVGLADIAKMATEDGYEFEGGIPASGADGLPYPANSPMVTTSVTIRLSPTPIEYAATSSFVRDSPERVKTVASSTAGGIICTEMFGRLRRW